MGLFLMSGFNFLGWCRSFGGGVFVGCVRGFRGWACVSSRRRRRQQCRRRRRRRCRLVLWSSSSGRLRVVCYWRVSQMFELTINIDKLIHETDTGARRLACTRTSLCQDSLTFHSPRSSASHCHWAHHSWLLRANITSCRRYFVPAPLRADATSC